MHELIPLGTTGLAPKPARSPLPEIRSQGVGTSTAQRSQHPTSFDDSSDAVVFLQGYRPILPVVVADVLTTTEYQAHTADEHRYIFEKPHFKHNVFIGAKKLHLVQGKFTLDIKGLIWHPLSKQWFAQRVSIRDTKAKHATKVQLESVSFDSASHVVSMNNCEFNFAGGKILHAEHSKRSKQREIVLENGKVHLKKSHDSADVIYAFDEMIISHKTQNGALTKNQLERVPAFTLREIKDNPTQVLYEKAISKLTITIMPKDNAKSTAPEILGLKAGEKLDLVSLKYIIYETEVQLEAGAEHIRFTFYPGQNKEVYRVNKYNKFGTQIYLCQYDGSLGTYRTTQAIKTTNLESGPTRDMEFNEYHHSSWDGTNQRWTHYHITGIGDRPFKIPGIAIYPGEFGQDFQATQIQLVPQKSLTEFPESLLRRAQYSVNDFRILFGRLMIEYNFNPLMFSLPRIDIDLPSLALPVSAELIERQPVESMHVRYVDESPQKVLPISDKDSTLAQGKSDKTLVYAEQVVFVNTVGDDRYKIHFQQVSQQADGAYNAQHVLVTKNDVAYINGGHVQFALVDVDAKSQQPIILLTSLYAMNNNNEFIENFIYQSNTARFVTAEEVNQKWSHRNASKPLWSKLLLPSFVAGLVHSLLTQFRRRKLVPVQVATAQEPAIEDKKPRRTPKLRQRKSNVESLSTDTLEQEEHKPEVVTETAQEKFERIKANKLAQINALVTSADRSAAERDELTTDPYRKAAFRIGNELENIALDAGVIAHQAKSTRRQGRKFYSANDLGTLSAKARSHDFYTNHPWVIARQQAEQALDVYLRSLVGVDIESLVTDKTRELNDCIEGVNAETTDEQYEAFTKTLSKLVIGSVQERITMLLDKRYADANKTFVAICQKFTNLNHRKAELRELMEYDYQQALNKPQELNAAAAANVMVDTATATTSNRADAISTPAASANSDSEEQKSAVEPPRSSGELVVVAANGFFGTKTDNRIKILSQHISQMQDTWKLYGLTQSPSLLRSVLLMALYIVELQLHYEIPVTDVKTDLTGKASSTHYLQLLRNKIWHRSVGFDADNALANFMINKFTAPNSWVFHLEPSPYVVTKSMKDLPRTSKQELGNTKALDLHLSNLVAELTQVKVKDAAEHYIPLSGVFFDALLTISDLWPAVRSKPAIMNAHKDSVNIMGQLSRTVGHSLVQMDSDSKPLPLENLVKAKFQNVVNVICWLNDNKDDIINSQSSATAEPAGLRVSPSP